MEVYADKVIVGSKKEFKRTRKLKENKKDNKRR